MTDPATQPDDDTVPEDFVEEISHWQIDHATDFSPAWDPRFEEGSDEPKPGQPSPKEPPIRDMGVRLVARSADGLTVVNTIEIFPPFDFSV